MTVPGSLHTTGPFAWTSDDGLWGVIEASALPRDCPRSKTRDTPLEAAEAIWDAGMTSRPGPASQHKFVKVRIADIRGGPAPQIVLRPSAYGPAPAKRHIPDYPGKCSLCGGGILVLFTSTEHEGGACPGPRAKEKARAR